MHKAFKFRIYPNRDQMILINKTIGCCRYVYNHFLAKWNETYEKTGKGLAYNTCSSQLKKGSNWIDDREEIKALIMNMTLGFIGLGYDGLKYYSRADNKIHIVIQQNGSHDRKKPRELDELDSLIDRILRSGLRFL